MIIAVTGSSGLVGRALIRALEADRHEVRRVVRGSVRDPSREIQWDPKRGTINSAPFKIVNAVVHLAGENIAGRRWSESVKEEIRSSRVAGTKLISEMLAALNPKPSVLVSASAIGFYGNRGNEAVSEGSPPGTGFLADVCQEWEAATEPARKAGIRVVNLRIGVILSRDGGALAQMRTPFKLGLGGVIGSGKQYFSWITLEDLVRAIQFVLATNSIAGPVNAVAPNPVTNYTLTKTLGRVLRRPTIFPMPAFAARLAFGEMADEMLLGGVCVEPRVLEYAGFRFQQPLLEPALRNALAASRTP